ncbi:MAG TPA: hypothetical protein VHM00_12015 [Caldimonas sp.]|nr:hypothetical protein [Caldimonas sp.]HEX2541793.1 hypothetical protein [Caldimonas sp.]
MKLSPARVEAWVWILIYGGLIVLSVGFALQQHGGALGIGVMLAGALAAALGVLLIWVRSRMSDAPDPRTPTDLHRSPP